ncbi:MAG TPA: DUF1570 domain-containing protein [Planctomycetota bacterium]|nr:DUF1570 domain-containing protein [Planctomycetota bacterium]
MKRARLVASLLAAMVPVLVRADEAEDAKAEKARKKASEEAAAERDNVNLEPAKDTTGDKRKKLEEAIAAFKSAKKHARKDGVREARRDLEKARTLLKAAAKDCPKEPLPLVYLAKLDEFFEDDKQFLADIKAAVALAPECQEALELQAEAHVRLDQFAEAEALYEKMLKLKPNDPNINVSRAYERMDAGKYKEALEDVNRALEAWPKSEHMASLKMRIECSIDGPSFWAQKFEKETENYVIRTDVSQDYADQMALHAEGIRKLYTATFAKLKLNLPKRKYNTYFFADQKEYHKFEPNPYFDGHYDPSTRELYTYKHEKDDESRRVMFHELLHQYLHPVLPHAPTWFNEGLGDYFSGAVLSNDPKVGAVIQPQAYDLDTIQRAIKGNVVHPVKEILFMSQTEFYEEGRMTLNYAQAWSFIYFLVQSRDGGNFKYLSDYFNACRKGQNMDEAFKTAFGSDKKMAALDDEWREFIVGVKKAG